MNILQQIFTDYYEHIQYILHPRPAIVENVSKMINCGDPSFGGAMYGCSHCGNLKFVPFRCKSRFCPTCGIHYSQKRTTSMSFKLVNCQHRHCVFTISEVLRSYFLKDRKLLDCLFHSVRDVILRIFYKMNKSENFTPGFICVLHTFGRSLHWNPHIHVLISEGAIGNFTPWKSVKHFNYTFMRNAFQTALLNQLEATIGPSFKKVKAAVYKDSSNGFYVYAKPNKCNPGHVAKYIGRYLGRPVIATSRIDCYDGDNVTFHYNRHEDDKLIVEKIPAIDFIKRLIRHIPEKHFKMIRYYGIYAKKHKNSHKLVFAIRKEKRKFLRSLNYWRESILFSFGYDPLKCSCGHFMTIMEVFHKKVALFDLFRKVMNST